MTKRGRGQPTKYSKEMLNKAYEYIDGGYIDEGHVVPSQVGLAVYLGVASTTVDNWAKAHEDFLGTLREIKDKQHLVALSGGLDGRFNSAITKLLLHNHGYTDKGEQTNKYIGADGLPADPTIKLTAAEAYRTLLDVEA